MFPTRLRAGSGTLSTHGEEGRRTRLRAARWAPALLVTLAVLLGACSAESPDSGSATTGSPKTTAPTEADEPSDGLFNPFDPDEPTLPGGVKVLSQDVEGFAPVDAGRYAVRVSESLLYQFDLPAYSDVHSGVYLNPGRRAGGDSIVWLTPANKRTALPVHPCRDHDRKVVGPTVGDLASALHRQPYLTTTKPVAVTVGGADGLFVKASVPDDANVSACQDGSVDVIMQDPQGVEEPGTVDRIWILDVDGVRHVLRARTFGATKRDAKLVTQLVKSITFTQD
jgi:hypothetical protein